MKPTVAWIGLGNMGGPMARNLQRAGFGLTVWNRSEEPCRPHAERGATVARSPRDAAASAEVTIVMVATPAAFDTVLSGPDGAVAGLRRGSLLIDMGTDGPPSARRAASLAAERGAAFVDAPVLGSRKPAEEGRLVVMAGGEPSDIDRARPLLEPLARVVRRVGPVGAGQAMKLATNLVLAHMLTGLAGSLALTRASGLSPADLVDLLEAALGSPYFRAKGSQMIDRDFEPAFSLDLVRKDVGLIREALAATGISLPTLGSISELFDAASSRGWGAEDGAAVVKLWWGD